MNNVKAFHDGEMFSFFLVSFFFFYFYSLEWTRRLVERRISRYGLDGLKRRKRDKKGEREREENEKERKEGNK